MDTSEVLENVTFRGRPLELWLQEMQIDVRSHMLTKNEWDPQGIQSLVTSVSERLDRAYDCLSRSKIEWQGSKRANRRKFNDLLEESVQRSGGRAQVTALKAGVESRMVEELNKESLLEAIKEFWEIQVDRLSKLGDNARQLAYLQSARSRLE
jgi:hypothetical protein